MKQLVTLTLGILALATPTTAAADEQPLGEHVSQCAQLLPSSSPPSIVCSHDGHTHTFATFGGMVLHMLEHHR